MSVLLINTEQELLEQVSKGNEQAFTRLFNLYHNPLGDFILRITESPLLTQEIVQDVFFKIWTSRASLSEVRSFKAYLFIVARNHAFNCLKQLAREKKYKKEWIRSALQDTSDALETTPPPDPGRLIEEAVNLLPPQQRKVYILSRCFGLKNTAIALQLNITPQTVKKHIGLALRFIKNYLRSHTAILLFFISGFLRK